MKRIIEGNVGLSIGFEWSEAGSEGGVAICKTAPGERVSHWAQTLFGWVDTQTRVFKRRKHVLSKSDVVKVARIGHLPFHFVVHDTFEYGVLLSSRFSWILGT